ncbi:MAG TPA: alpha/beta hydrolase [Nitriliruptorales bacterium]|nr:alpha/beta hydrolase [Nitriliruptorales bacterium]
MSPTTTTDAPTSVSPARPRRSLRTAVWALVGLLLVVYVGLGLAGYVYSSELLEPTGEQAVTDDLQVRVQGGLIELPRTEVSALDGVWGVMWPEGYGQALDVLDTGPDRVVRVYRRYEGVPDEGQLVRLDPYAFPGDPQEAYGVGFEDVTFDTDLGPMPAWRIPGRDDTWAIFVHGRGGDRREGLRVLPSLLQLGLPTLLIAYRNDPGAPTSDDGHHTLGATEWRDLEGAVRYALDQGARDVVLVGSDMGGQIAATFVHESELADRVRALVLDAPTLDWDAVLRAQAERRGRPGFLSGPARIISALRAGIDWSVLDQVGHADEFDLPILLFHGTADEQVPISSSDRFAAAVGEEVTYVRVEAAPHNAAWNVDPGAYQAAVEDFLRPASG